MGSNWTHKQLRNAPLFDYGLFPDAVIRTAEQDITNFETTSRAQTRSSASQQSGWRSSHIYQPYNKKDNSSAGSGDQEQQPRRQSVIPEEGAVVEVVAQTLVFQNQGPTSSINDNYFVCPTLLNKVKCRLDKNVYDKTVQTFSNSLIPKIVKSHSRSLNPQDVSCAAVNLVHSINYLGHPQKKGLSPVVLGNKIKNVKGASCVNQCLSAPHAQSVPNAVLSLAVGGRLQKFWQKWQALGANPRVVSILQEGYMLRFKIRPPLTHSPLIKSGYAHPVKSRCLKEALQDLINKLVVERVVVRSSLAFYNRLFLVPKPNNKWRPILDLSQLNVYLQTSTFKMETLETIRVSLQKGEWVTSLDFRDAYFHIPIQPRSRKFFEQQGTSVHSPSLRAGHSPIGIYQGGHRSEADGSDQGYKKPPVT